MSLAQSASLGLETRFKVVVDGIDLGGWDTCRGLAVNFNVEPLEEGGEYGFVHLLAGHVKYETIKLTRAMTSSDSGRVQSWLSSKVDSFSGGTAQITLLDSKGQPVQAWSLRNVHPSSWKGPDLDANSGKVAKETLELMHEGFL